MKKLNQIPIKRLIVGSSVVCIAVLLVVQLMFYADVAQDVQHSQRATAQAVAGQIVNNFEIRSRQLKDAVEFLSTDKTMLQYITSDSRMERYELLKLLDSSIEYIYLSQRDLRDIVIVDINGNATSFFSVLNNSDLGQIHQAYNLEDASNRQTGVLYLPSEDNTRNDSFACMLPVFETRMTGDFRTKVATVILYYSIQSIRDEVVSLAEIPDMRVSLVDASGMVLASGCKNVGAHLDINQSYAPLPQATQFSQNMDYFGWSVHCEYSAALITSGNELYLRYMVLLVVVSVSGILLISFLMNRFLNNPVQELLRQMHVSVGQSTSARIQMRERNEIGELADGINEMLERIGDKTMMAIQAQEKLYTTELLRQSAELKALSSQINPHFLYNTLECIRGMALMNDQDTIAEIATAMAAIFRYSIKGSNIVTVAEEWRMIEYYLFIIRCRFGDRYRIEQEIEDGVRPFLLPKMVIQPIVENAVVHGLSNKESGGMLRIACREEGDYIHFCVSDNGGCFPPELMAKLQQDDSYQDAVDGMGLCNIRSRLQLLMGPEAVLQLRSMCNLTEVSVILPKRQKMNEI